MWQLSHLGAAPNQGMVEFKGLSVHTDAHRGAPYFAGCQLSVFGPGQVTTGIAQRNTHDPARPSGRSAKRWAAPAAKTLAGVCSGRGKFTPVAVAAITELLTRLGRHPPTQGVRQLTYGARHVTPGRPAVSQGHESRKNRRQQ
jgi:hypothetical protein